MNLDLLSFIFIYINFALSILKTANATPDEYQSDFPLPIPDFLLQTTSHTSFAPTDSSEQNYK